MTQSMVTEISPTPTDVMKLFKSTVALLDEADDRRSDDEMHVHYATIDAILNIAGGIEPRDFVNVMHRVAGCFRRIDQVRTAIMMEEDLSERIDEIEGLLHMAFNGLERLTGIDRGACRLDLYAMSRSEEYPA